MAVMDGVDKVLKTLEEVRKLGEHKILATAGLAAGGIIENQWKENIQNEPLIRTGTYRRSIHRQVFQNVGEPGNVVVLIGTDIDDPPYPAFLEWGTSRMPAHPVGRRALEEKRDEALKEFAQVAQQLIEEAAR